MLFDIRFALIFLPVSTVILTFFAAGGLSMDIFWMFNLPFSILCMPMMIQMWRLNKRTGAMSTWDLIKAVGACFIPMLNIAMFFKAYLEPDQRYWITTRVAIRLIDEMDRRLEQAIAEDKDMLAVMLYGEPLMRYDIPEDELNKLLWDDLRIRVVRHMMNHCEHQGHSVTICEDAAGKRFFQVNLGGLKNES